MSDCVPECDDTLKDHVCECGHRWGWYVEMDPADMEDWERELSDPPYVRLEEDVIEQRCPHDNGTILQHCPKCFRRVGIWGFGIAGDVECECWD